METEGLEDRCPIYTSSTITGHSSTFFLLLDKVGSEEDMFMPLNEVGKTSGIDYSSKYSALRITQGEILGNCLNEEWKTSVAAIRLYHEAKEER